MLKLAQYAGMWVDLLGQGEKLSKITAIPTSESEKTRILSLLSATFGAVKSASNAFETFYSGLKTIGREYTQDEIEILKKIKRADIRKIHFSDTIIHLVPLTKSSENNPVYGVLTILKAAASVMLASLAARSPMRGAVEIGILLEVGPNDFYGPLYQKMHYLETNIAKWPRIVVGPTLCEYLADASRHSDRHISMIGKMALDLIGKDEDCSYLDYLKLGSLAEGEGLRRMITAAKEFVLASSIEYAFDVKLGPRYNLLQKYFDQYRSVN